MYFRTPNKEKKKCVNLNQYLILKSQTIQKRIFINLPFNPHEPWPEHPFGQYA